MNKECSKCGWCCSYLTFIVPRKRLNEGDKRYFEYHGVTFERRDRNTDYEHVYSRCVHLTSENLCDIFSTRPDICDRTRRGSHKIYIKKGCTGE